MSQPKPVYKYSLKGKLLKCYESTASAAGEFMVNESSIRRAADRQRESCGYLWSRIKVGTIADGEEQHKAAPRILLIDIETAPILAFVFQKQVWKARISSEKIYSDWFILTYSCKWLGEPDIISARVTSKEAREEDDSRLVDQLWRLLSEADIVIAHNGNSFDIPNINTRFVVHGYPPASAYKQIDTLLIAQKYFGFTHNNLDALAEKLGIEGKIPTDFELWKKCWMGDDEALAEMEIYNRHDVEILEEVYLKLRPYMKSHPNFNLYTDDLDPVCPTCGSKHVKFDGYYYFTQTRRYKNYRCLECGALSRDKGNSLDKNKTLLVSNGQ